MKTKSAPPKKDTVAQGGAGGAAPGGLSWRLRHCATAPVPFRGRRRKWRSKGLLAGALLAHEILRPLGGAAVAPLVVVRCGVASVQRGCNELRSHSELRRTITLFVQSPEAVAITPDSWSSR